MTVEDNSSEYVNIGRPSNNRIVGPASFQPTLGDGSFCCCREVARSSRASMQSALLRVGTSFALSRMRKLLPLLAIGLASSCRVTDGLPPAPDLPEDDEQMKRPWCEPRPKLLVKSPRRFFKNCFIERKICNEYSEPGSCVQRWPNKNARRRRLVIDVHANEHGYAIHRLRRKRSTTSGGLDCSRLLAKSLS